VGGKGARCGGNVDKKREKRVRVREVILKKRGNKVESGVVSALKKRRERTVYKKRIQKGSRKQSF